MFLVIVALVGLITAPLTINKMEKANQTYRDREFKQYEKQIEKEYGIPHRPTLKEVK